MTNEFSPKITELNLPNLTFLFFFETFKDIDLLNEIRNIKWNDNLTILNRDS